MGAVVARRTRNAVLGRHLAAQGAEQPRAPDGVAAFMSAHSKTPYITPSMEFCSEEGVVRGRMVHQLWFTLRHRMPLPLNRFVSRLQRHSYLNIATNEKKRKGEDAVNLKKAVRHCRSF